jgi:thioredoxin:protein disulfide reductase
MHDKFLSIVLALLALAAPSAAEERTFLKPDEAFVISAQADDTGRVLFNWDVADGYYLYQTKFRFVSDTAGVVLGDPILPDAEIKDDPIFGKVGVYRDDVTVTVPLDQVPANVEILKLRARSQGCAEDGICYPPHTQTVLVAIDQSVDQPPPVDPNRVQAFPPSGNDTESSADRFGFDAVEEPFFLAGLLLAFTPCVFPMVPILSGIIVGQGDRLTTLRAFWLSVVYVLAMAVTYTVAGVLAGLFGQNLQAAFQNPWIISGFVLVFILLALSMFGFYELQLPSAACRPGWRRPATASGRQLVGGGRDGLPVGPDRRPLRGAAADGGADRDRLLG